MLRPRPWRITMVVRSHNEGHRQASWLELLFDLAFVVAVAQAAGEFEHALAAGHPGEGLVGYLIVFCAIWWAWMAFTWFANVFDTDDVPYRLLMLVMIAGSLGLAAGVPQIAHLDLRIGVISYVVMRLAYVGQWLRVFAGSEGRWRSVAWKMIVLTTLIQGGWVLMLWLPADWRLTAFVVWFAVDVSTPFVAGWDASMGGHRHHIIERYGLFTIIVLGETILAATVAIGEAVGTDIAVGPLLTLALGGLIAVFALWWIYFDFSSGLAPAASRGAQYAWGYLHYFVFASLAAVGAGIALAVAWLTDPAHVAMSELGVALVIAGSVTSFLLAIAVIESVAGEHRELRYVVAKLLGAASTIAAGFLAPTVGLPGSVLLVAAVLSLLVAYGVAEQHRLVPPAAP